MIYKVKLKDFLKIADIALTRQQACCNMVITKNYITVRTAYASEIWGTTDKKKLLTKPGTERFWGEYK